MGAYLPFSLACSRLDGALTPPYLLLTPRWGMRLTHWLIRYLAGCVAATLIAILITRVCRYHRSCSHFAGCLFMLGCTQQPVVPFTAKYCVLIGSYGDRVVNYRYMLVSLCSHYKRNS